jgi:DNA segregation ATPase FtsK/SpoIIIE-like protein
MTFIAANRRGGFEARESSSTPDGPRSRTLATFRELDPATIKKIVQRATHPTSGEEIMRAALRAGATVSATPADESARATLRSIARGERPSPKLHRLLLEALGGDEPPQAAAWLGTSSVERGEALWDLLLLADAIPIRRRPKNIGFPRLDST